MSKKTKAKNPSSVKPLSLLAQIIRKEDALLGQQKPEHYARLTGCSVGQVKHAIRELQKAGHHGGQL